MRVHIGRFPKDGSERKISVKLHKWDSWNADHTIAIIAHPLLVQLKETKHGSPQVDIEDVPDDLKDKDTHRRWDWVLEWVLV